MEFNTILRELGPAWDVDVVAEAYNLTLVDKALYTGIIKQLAPADLLLLYYIFGSDSFARVPSPIRTATPKDDSESGIYVVMYVDG